ncbi:hypothetical protein A33M_1373 [Rhodovulum sp. PH10]|nr:hypothetical protein A33M_1373 [Rhodovulum sp. PH10]
MRPGKDFAIRPRVIRRCRRVGKAVAAESRRPRRGGAAETGRAGGPKRQDGTEWWGRAGGPDWRGRVEGRAGGRAAGTLGRGDHRTLVAHAAAELRHRGDFRPVISSGAILVGGDERVPPLRPFGSGRATTLARAPIGRRSAKAAVARPPPIRYLGRRRP